MPSENAYLLSGRPEVKMTMKIETQKNPFAMCHVTNNEKILLKRLKR